MAKHLDSYIEIMKQSSPEAVDSILNTIKELSPQHIESFNHKERIKGLLLGQVQSGKTGQIFGLMASAADIDVGFQVFILLTSDINALQQQTYKRALETMDTFNVCNEHDEIRFNEAGQRKPSIIVLKKNSTILKKWRNILTSSDILKGRPVFIVDDEADAASLNTLVNQSDQSAINKHLEAIIKLATSSFYLQVTATPQALLLQTEESGWRPSFTYYFPPGKQYLGGDFFYTNPKPFTNITTEDNELDVLLDSDDMAIGLQQSIETFLITAAHVHVSSSSNVCNFLVHPSVRIKDHRKIRLKISAYLAQVLNNLNNQAVLDRLEIAWRNLKSSKPDIKSFKMIVNFLASKPKINIITLNSMDADGALQNNHDAGINIIIGGISLGRGVTFKGLQTVYYCRTSSTPQADTFWQHCRMFGYDRDPALMRIFMPLPLFNLFAEIHISNEALRHHMAKSQYNPQIITNKKFRPTRKAVLDRDRYAYLVGGVNYFPPYPNQNNADEFDSLLKDYDETKHMHDISLQDAMKIIKKLQPDPNTNWSVKAFEKALEALHKHQDAPDLVKLIVRRNRNIGAKTGTLLSPDDRKLGSTVDNLPVLTMYRLTGASDKGWDGNPFWFPNIKLPAGKIFHRID